MTTARRPQPGDHSATATGVDAVDVVVGYSDQQAVRWQLDGTIEPLPVPANHIQSRAEGVNGHGEVVGFIATSPDWKTTYVKWNTDGTTTPLPQPGNGSASPTAINDNGVVVGNQRSSDVKDFNALQWAQGGAPTKLGSLPGEQYSVVAGCQRDRHRGGQRRSQQQPDPQAAGAPAAPTGSATTETHRPQPTSFPDAVL